MYQNHVNLFAFIFTIKIDYIAEGEDGAIRTALLCIFNITQYNSCVNSFFEKIFFISFKISIFKFSVYFLQMSRRNTPYYYLSGECLFFYWIDLSLILDKPIVTVITCINYSKCAIIVCITESKETVSN